MINSENSKQISLFITILKYSIRIIDEHEQRNKERIDYLKKNQKKYERQRTERSI